MESKPLGLSDFETGVEYERQLAMARQHIDTLTQGYQIFINNVRARYNAPNDKYELRDWAEGFVPVEIANANIPDN